MKVDVLSAIAADINRRGIPAAWNMAMAIGARTKKATNHSPRHRDKLNNQAHEHSHRTRTGTFRTFLLAAEVIRVGAAIARIVTGISAVPITAAAAIDAYPTGPDTVQPLSVAPIAPAARIASVHVRSMNARPVDGRVHVSSMNARPVDGRSGSDTGMTTSVRDEAVAADKCKGAIAIDSCLTMDCAGGHLRSATR